jgi:hypothetical protein
LNRKKRISKAILLGALLLVATAAVASAAQRFVEFTVPAYQ